MAHIQLRIPIEDKRAAGEILEKLGLNFSSAIKLFLKQVVSTGGLPFKVALKRKNTAQIPFSPKENKKWTNFGSRKIG